MQLENDQGRRVWLAYAMNVHPGGDARALLCALDHTVGPLRERLALRGPMGLALRLSARGVDELLADRSLARQVQERFALEQLVPFTGNAFVHGAFHEPGVKASVYAPPWGTPERTRYTLSFARLLASWHPAGAEVSLSSAPGSWRAWPEAAGGERQRAQAVAQCAAALCDLRASTGVSVRLGLEPEPGCTLDMTEDVLAFFAGALASALSDKPGAAEHVGLCYDVCHQAVMHEDGPAALGRLREAGIQIVKLQASSALEVPDPSDPLARTALAQFDDPVYLHQVSVPMPGRRPQVVAELGQALQRTDLFERRPWRVHFHVPVDRQSATAPLATTRLELERTLTAALVLESSSHVEIETYTWDVLPAAERADFDLVEALAREYEWTLGVAGRAGYRPVQGGAA